MSHYGPVLRAIRVCLICVMAMMMLLCGMTVAVVRPDLLMKSGVIAQPPVKNPATESGISGWTPPDTSAIPHTPDGDLIRYGYNLVSHTSAYLGPDGSVKTISNGMNCQNCHLDAGTRPFGNNYAAVASTYPRFRPRSGTVESVEKRVNDCIQRSLNGKPLDHEDMEMKAFVAYIIWVGQSVPKGSIPESTGISAPAFLDRPADPDKGRIVYEIYCMRCHGTNGEGVMAENGTEWKYPPLFGNESYNTGAGLYRLSRFAGFVKYNMPFDIVPITGPVLTDEEAWDVAAFVNSQARPSKNFSKDWPDISTKPFDHPFGPFADGYTESQHKYGPFKNMMKKKG